MRQMSQTCMKTAFNGIYSTQLLHLVRIVYKYTQHYYRPFVHPIIHLASFTRIPSNDRYIDMPQSGLGLSS